MGRRFSARPKSEGFRSHFATYLIGTNINDSDRSGEKLIRAGQSNFYLPQFVLVYLGKYQFFDESRLHTFFSGRASGLAEVSIFSHKRTLSRATSE